ASNASAPQSARATRALPNPREQRERSPIRASNASAPQSARATRALPLPDPHPRERQRALPSPPLPAATAAVASPVRPRQLVQPADDAPQHPPLVRAERAVPQRRRHLEPHLELRRFPERDPVPPAPPPTRRPIPLPPDQPHRQHRP